MQKGQIVAAGTSLRLKSKYGKGYRLILTSPEEPQATKPPAASAVLESAAADQIIWRIEDAAELANVVRWADVTKEQNLRQRRNEATDSDQLAIKAWEISMPTLEDVLLEKRLF